jgi:hypothetical protein
MKDLSYNVVMMMMIIVIMSMGWDCLLTAAMDGPIIPHPCDI